MDKEEKGLIRFLKYFFYPDKQKEFGRDQYEEIEKTGKAPCPEGDCNGYVKYVRTRPEKAYCEALREDILFYRCNLNCRHHWKVIKNNLNDKLVFQKY